ncbi:MAG: hydrolase [Variovorax paradoxus]|uniref:Hydrolase n=1 Tax=Variovorax paradoxus TaxID=34073 RepID=A0A2W5QJJ9_VARPD|nr:MAG: hydrolase [Variovorax paradoxus]
MSDSDIAGNAWRIPPSAYLARRSTDFTLGKPSSCYVAMDDGCKLAVDIYQPQGAYPGQTFPTIVIFTPYFRRFALKGEGAEPTPNIAKYRDFFVRYGYVLVAVDVRGTGASFGTRDSFRSPRERKDSSRIADWVVAQPWSNGVIGSTGISYLGAAACFLASTGHPSVRAIAPLFSVNDIYSEQLYPGGMMSRVWSSTYDELMLALDHDDPVKRARFPYYSDSRLGGPQQVDEDADGSLLAAAIAQHRDNFRLHDLLPELAFRGEGPLHDPDLTTDACSPYTYLLSGAAPDLPIYSVSGWLDGGGYANGSITRFMTMRGSKDRLLLGPWDHGARVNGSPWRASATPEFPLLAEVLRFFDQHLCGMETGLEAEEPVHYHSMHGERWHAARDWPPIETAQTLYADALGGLGPQAPAQARVPYQVRFDMGTGKETRWERLGTLDIKDYFFDWHGRDDAMLNFTSGVVEADVELSGHIHVTVKFISSQADAAVFAYASEVESDGTCRYITEGLLRASHRATATPPENYQCCWPYRTFTRDDATRLEPGKETSMTFALLPVSWTLRAGSRLRISLAGADCDHFAQVPHGRPPLLEFLIGRDGTRFDVPLRSGFPAPT